ncbi:GIY-YIG nuclease family protein [Alcaligenaceae bacterium]|nr:GIY-YIG nuclease family protein [Alcaligenaceae bacterium]
MVARRTRKAELADEVADKLGLDKPLSDTSARELPFETQELRDQLRAYLRHKWADPHTGEEKAVGSYQWGVYAFYDYDKEPIYVGQTNERLSGRIGRHLTNQRTDAVAMSVLDPYEVCYIEVWPMAEVEGVKLTKVQKEKAKSRLNALEYEAYIQLIKCSKFGAILNEKPPTTPEERIALPPSHFAQVVSDEVSRLRDHPDLRIARRASTIARLSKVIAERKVQSGLRQTLLTQARRLADLAARRVGDAPANLGAPSSEDDGG